MNSNTLKGDIKMMLKELNVNDLVSMDIAEAKKLIFSKGWRFRVVRQDGIDLVHSAEHRNDRVNLRVASGIVTDATIG